MNVTQTMEVVSMCAPIRIRGTHAPAGMVTFSCQITTAVTVVYLLSVIRNKQDPN